MTNPVWTRKYASPERDLQLSAARIALVRTYEDHMTKIPASKETKAAATSGKSGATELRDDELQAVSGGLAVQKPTQPPKKPVCLSMS